MGRGPHTALVRALLRHAGVGSPCGREPRGSRSSRISPPRVAVPSGGGGVPSAPGGRRAAPVAPKLGRGAGAGGRGGEGGETPPPWFAPPSSPGWPLIRPLRLRRPGRRRSAVGRQQAGRVGACLGPGAPAPRVQRPLRGGVWGRRFFGVPRSALGPEWEGGGGEWGGPSGPLAPPPDGRGGKAAWRARPRGPGLGWGVAPFPRPPLPRAGPSCRPSLGPLIPPAVVARRWPAGGGREG